MWIFHISNHRRKLHRLLSITLIYIYLGGDKKAERPKFGLAAKAFNGVYDDIGKSVSAVGTLIGGKADYYINKLTPAQGQFQNACAIRMSYVLNNPIAK